LKSHARLALAKGASGLQISTIKLCGQPFSPKNREKRLAASLPDALNQAALLNHNNGNGQ